VRMFSQEFGLSPSSATRVRAVSASTTQEEKHQQSSEAFLFRGGKVVGHVGRGGRRQEQDSDA
jgi:hypothetical protein